MLIAPSLLTMLAGRCLMALSAPHRPEIDEAVVAASHQDWPQVPVASQSVLSSLAAHVVQASS